MPNRADELKVYKGNYEEYQKLRALEAAAEIEVEPEESREATAERDRERAKEERRQRKAAEKRLEQAAAMEARIHELEAELARLSMQLEAASVAGDVAKVHRLGVAYQETDAELHRVMAEWAELA